MSNETHYQTLGVGQDANESEIKKAFRAMSLKYHPDRNPNEDTKAKFQSINEAYETLSDPQKRQQYDMELQFGGAHGMPPFGFGHGGGMPFSHMSSFDEFSDINQIFNMMFQGGFGGGGPNIRVFHGPGGMNTQMHFQTHVHIQKPEAIVKTVQLTLEQAYTGCNVPVEIERIVQTNEGRINEIETLYINVPQGIDDNETMVIQDKGHCINNSVHGDVKIVFRIETNEATHGFKRQGLDLIYQKKISLVDALCGFSFEMAHLNGRMLCLNNTSNPTVIKPKYRKVIPNMGMVREMTTGNMIIEFDVEFPDSVSADQVAKLREVFV